MKQDQEVKSTIQQELEKRIEKYFWFKHCLSNDHEIVMDIKKIIKEIFGEVVK